MKLIQVVDGDTIVVMLGGKYVTVRYLGMDAAAVSDPKAPGGLTGRQAAAANASLVTGKAVWLEDDTSDTDSHGRLLRYVWHVEGQAWALVNLELIRLGFARAVSHPPDTRYDQLFLAAERDASAAGRGLWAPSLSPASTRP